MFQPLVRYVQVLRTKVDVRVILFTLIAGGIVRPWHDTEAE